MMQNQGIGMPPQINGLLPLSQGAYPQNETQLYSREDIVAMVKQHETDNQPLITRMEGDYSLYKLNEHVNYDHETGEPLLDYAVYTSNDARVFADKVISWITLSELLVRAPHMEVGEHKEEADNLKERFAIGCLRAADERLKRLLQPALRGSLAFYTVVRGGYIGGRCLLVKNRDGSTHADITAWDPMHTHWCLGADGLDWICHKIKMTRAQIKRVYGVDAQGTVGTGDAIKGSSDAEREGIEVYDFYDRSINTVVTDKEVLKPPMPHGSPRVPAYLVLVGPVPLLQSENASNLIADVGESVYADVRGIYNKWDDILSIFLEIVERARRQTVIMESRDGKKKLPEDPFKQGTDIATVTGERIYTLELQKMAQETGAYMNVVWGQIQRATLNAAAYGETPFQLSGYAIEKLTESSETVLASRIAAMSQMYLQIANLLYDQFMTGAFDGIKLSGMDSHRTYFSQMVSPEMLQGTCDYTVKMVTQLPQDDMSKWAIAEIAEKGHFLSRLDILNDIVGVQDAQQAIDKVKAEMAEQGLPEAVLYSMMMAAANRGEYQLAALYMAEYQRLMAVKAGLMPDMAPGGAGGKPAQGKPHGQRPEVMPNAATGAQPTPAQNAGGQAGPSFQAPGTPRPGAQGQPNEPQP